MLQIVFSDSECGSLKLATHWGPSSWDDGPIGFIFGDGEREPTQEEKDIQTGYLSVLYLSLCELYSRHLPLRAELSIPVLLDY